MDSTATNAFLVRLSISQFSARKIDRAATREAQERAGANDKAGVKVSKRILAAEALEKIASIAGAAREEHEKRTVPWQYKGPGAITAAGYPAYKAAMAQLEQEFRAAVEEFCAVYTRERDEAKDYLGSLFNPADYPSLDEIRARFSFAVICEPMPQSQDFRVGGLSSQESHAIKHDMDKRFKQTIAQAQAEAWERIVDHVERLKAKVESYKPKADGHEKTEGRFHDTLVENLRELVEVLPSLNITNDPALSQIALRMKSELCSTSAQELRESQTARVETSQKAEAILQQVQEIWAARMAGQSNKAA